MKRKFISILFIIIVLTFFCVSTYVSATDDFDFISNDIINTEKNNITYTNSSSTENTTEGNNTIQNSIDSSNTTLPETGTEDDDSYTYSSSNPEDRKTNTIKRTLAGKEVSSTEYKNSKYNAEYITTETGKKVGIGTLRNFEIVDENGNISYYSQGSTDNETYNNQTIAKSERVRL